MMERISAFLALSIIAQIRHPNLPGSLFVLLPTVIANLVDFEKQISLTLESLQWLIFRAK